MNEISHTNIKAPHVWNSTIGHITLPWRRSAWRHAGATPNAALIPSGCCNRWACGRPPVAFLNNWFIAKWNYVCCSIVKLNDTWQDQTQMHAHDQDKLSTFGKNRVLLTRTSVLMLRSVKAKHHFILSPIACNDNTYAICAQTSAAVFASLTIDIVDQWRCRQRLWRQWTATTTGSHSVVHNSLTRLQCKSK